MKYILVLLIICSLNAKAQTADTIMNMGGIRCLVAHYTKDGIFTCNFKGTFYPDRIYDTSIKKWFIEKRGADSLFYFKTDTVDVYIWNGRPKNEIYGYESMEMRKTGFGMTAPWEYTTDTISFKRQNWRPAFKQ
jgi:hypothetical protein